MFIPTGTRPSGTLRPANSLISPGDWELLADYWYPVALSRDLGAKPLAAQLLDVPLVLYRGTGSEIAIAVDVCPHRHVRLSGGQVVDGQIQCPFHGLQFDVEGKCSRVPALGREAKLPASYRVQTFPAIERYGMVWTCVGDADRHSVPDFPSLSNSDPSEFAYTVPVVWPVSSARQVENFTDLAHLPFVHATTLGGDQMAPVSPGRIKGEDGAFTMEAHIVESAPDGSPMPCDLRYRVVLPFSVEFRTLMTEEPDRFILSCDVATPVSAHACQVFQVIKHPQGRDAAEAMVDHLTEINEQDIALLSTLMLPDLPLEQHHEIHLPVDNISGFYRRQLRSLGLGGKPGNVAGSFGQAA
jgi:vanillate O-demethylase monooxygenase subunit